MLLLIEVLMCHYPEAEDVVRQMHLKLENLWPDMLSQSWKPSLDMPCNRNKIVSGEGKQTLQDVNLLAQSCIKIQEFILLADEHIHHRTQTA